MMANERVGDMTPEELKEFIRNAMWDGNKRTRQLGDGKDIAETLNAIDQHRWTPPPGAPSGSEILLDERERRSEDVRKDGKPNEKRFVTFVEHAQKLLGLVVGLGVLLTVGGFAVINTYLAQLTKIQIYLVHPSQIIAAGIWFAILALLFSLLLLGILYATFKIVPSVFDGIIYLWKWLRNRKKPIWEKNDKYPLENFEKIYMAGSVITFLVVLFPNSFAVEIYKTIPRELGGGHPEPVILIFKLPETSNLLNLTSESASQTQRTQPLLLLVELAEGILVYDPHTERVVAVNNDQLVGRLEQKLIPLSSLPYPITMSTATP